MSEPSPEEPLVSPMGEAAFLLESRQALNDATQERMWALADTLGAWPAVRELVIGVNNVLVLLRPDAPEDVAERLRHAWLTSGSATRPGRLVTIPVDYGGPAGLDVDDLVASTGFPAAELFRRHAAPDYVVSTVGSMPGFAYLSGLDPALATPRRTEPRTRVEAGAVMLGGFQAGILPITAPTGWHVLGRTDTALFTPEADPPVLLEPGDRVRFVVRSVR